MASTQGSFIRWQSIVITQLGYAINLILTFSVAALGFQVNFLRSNTCYLVPCCQKCVCFLSLVSLVFLTVSVLLAILAVINRLKDFRKTAKIARMRENGAEDEVLRPLRDHNEKLGNITWCLFRWQIGTFSIGAFCIVLSVLSELL